MQEYEQQYCATMGRAKQQPTEASDAAADAVSTAALLAALGLVLGALAAWFGGRMGAVEPTITARLGLSRAQVSTPSGPNDRTATLVAKNDVRPTTGSPTSDSRSP